MAKKTSKKQENIESHPENSTTSEIPTGKPEFVSGLSIVDSQTSSAIEDTKQPELDANASTEVVNLHDIPSDEEATSELVKEIQEEIAQEVKIKEEPKTPTPEPVINITPVVSLRKLGKIVATGDFLRSTTDFFTALHRQGYVILSREQDQKRDTITFLLEGGIFDAIPEGSVVPEYNFTFGNRLVITKK